MMFRFRKASILGGCATAAVIVVAPAVAAGPVTVGQTFVPTVDSTCTGSPDWEVLQTRRADGTSYQAATGGVLTSWSFMTGAGDSTVTMRVFRPAGPGSYTVVAEGGPLRTLPASSGLHTFPVRIPVQAGDIVGLRGQAGYCATQTSDGSDIFFFHDGTAIPVGGTAAFSSNTGFIWDISAALEADADSDGYGDTTQDACPQSAAAQAACPPPETTVTKKPGKKTDNRRVKIKFTSTVPGSTFTCSRDGKAFKPCTSPYKKRLSLGKHKILIQAISPAGIPEAAPAKVKFKILSD